MLSKLVKMGTSYNSPALQFKILAECPVTKARTSLMTLPHGTIETPVFMPVGTQVKFIFG
jgi:hypothetical protein